MSTNRRAFTLIELAVALAMTGIVAVAALSTFSMVTRYRMRLQLMTAVDDTAKVITSYLVREVQRMGGAALRPYQAVGVRNCDPESPNNLEDFTCITSDAITLAFFDDSAVLTSCPVTQISDGGNSFKIFFDMVPNPSDSTASVCCPLLRYDAAGNFTQVLPADMTNHNFIIEHDGMHMGVTLADHVDGCAWWAFRSHQSRAFVSAGPNDESLTEEQKNDMNNLAVTAAELNPESGRGTSATPVVMSTLFVGCPQTLGGPENVGCSVRERGLYLFSDSDGALTPEAMTYSATDTYKLLAPGIADLRFRLGLDRDRSGFVGNPLNDYDAQANDREWMSFERLATLSDRFQMDSLVMFQISLIASGAVHDPTFQNSAYVVGADNQVFSSPGMYFVSSYTRMALRGLANYR